MCFVAEANVLRQHGRCAWVAPTYKNSRPLWRLMQNAFRPLANAGVVKISVANQTIQTYKGGFFAVYSGEGIDAMRGEWFHLVINDEAARLTEEARYDVIEPTVADTDGDIFDISTPAGRNWFYREHQMGKHDQDGRASFHAPSKSNPMIGIQAAFINAKRRLPERTFRQEWLAEFIDDTGGVFRRVRDRATAEWQHQALPGHQYIMGVDWGRTGDFTVFSVIDVGRKEQVHMERFTQVDYETQLGRFRGLYSRFKPTACVVEENSMGGPLVERLQLEGFPVIPFYTSRSSKEIIIRSLESGFDHNEITILPDEIQVDELLAYEQLRTLSGWKFGAPEGMHDDTVIALALAWHGAGFSEPLRLYESEFLFGG